MEHEQVCVARDDEFGVAVDRHVEELVIVGIAAYGHPARDLDKRAGLKATDEKAVSLAFVEVSLEFRPTEDRPKLGGYCLGEEQPFHQLGPVEHPARYRVSH